MHCLLCGFETTKEFRVEGPRMLLWFCPECHFVAKDPEQFPNSADEKTRYDLHENGSEGHRAFLRPVSDAVTEHVAPGARGLDWGCGPVPVLAELLGRSGYPMRTYDAFYPGDFDPTTAREGFDFITLTEVIEHLHSPADELLRMTSLLRPRGRLVIQTQLWENEVGTDPTAKFPRWSYRRDRTHVGFYSRRTFERFEKLFGLRLIRGAASVFVFELAAAMSNQSTDKSK